jgi:hypothetical protein
MTILPKMTGNACAVSRQSSSQRRWVHRTLVVPAALTLLALSIGAQTPGSAAGKVPCRTQPGRNRILTHGGYRAIRPGLDGSPVLVDSIRFLAQHQCLPEIRALLFGSTYTPQLVDWVVYVDDTVVVDGLTLNDKDLNRDGGRPPILRGEKRVGIIVLIERPGVASIHGLGTGDSVLIRRDVLRYQPSPFVAQFLNILSSKVLGGLGVSNPTSQVGDSVFFIKLQDLGPGTTNTHHLFLAFGSVHIGDDMWARLNLLPPPGKVLQGESAVLTNFVNTGASRVSFSIGAGAIGAPQTFSRSIRSIAIRRDSLVQRGAGAPDTIRLADTTFAYARQSHPTEWDMYLLLHLEAWPRRRPWPVRSFLTPWGPESISVFVGTNLVANKLGSRIPLGISLDRLNHSEFGLAFGAVWVTEQPWETGADGSMKLVDHRTRKLFGSLTVSF